MTAICLAIQRNRGHFGRERLMSGAVIPAPDIPGHTVIGLLGSGGFGSVYRTWQTAVGRETAVKVDSRALHSERDRRRFFREVTAAGRLSGHPHIIDVYDAGTLPDSGARRDSFGRCGPRFGETHIVRAQKD